MSLKSHHRNVPCLRCNLSVFSTKKSCCMLARAYAFCGPPFPPFSWQLTFPFTSSKIATATSLQTRFVHVFSMVLRTAGWRFQSHNRSSEDTTQGIRGSGLIAKQPRLGCSFADLFESLANTGFPRAKFAERGLKPTLRPAWTIPDAEPNGVPQAQSTQFSSLHVTF